MSVDEIDEVLLRFPKWFYEQLCARRFILPDEAVTFVLKRKSRALGEDDFKVSYHFIVEIAGTPLWHRAVCAEIFQPYAADIRSIQTTKSLDHLLDDQIRQPMFYVDVATLHGHQGFATYFSRKKTTDPYPLLLRRMAFKNGKLVAERHFAPPPHEPSEPTALQHLLNASYTVPKIYVANYADSVAVMVRHFLFCLLIGTRGIEPHGCHFFVCCLQAIPKRMPTGSTTKKGPSNSALRPHGRCSGSGAPPDLPAWFERLLAKHGGLSGCVWNHDSPFLDRHRDTLKTVLGLERVTCVHVKNFLCPAKLCRDKKQEVCI